MLNPIISNLKPTWKKLFSKLQMLHEWALLDDFLQQEYKLQHTIYPNKSQIFSAFQALSSELNVVILGQDPYHGVECIDGKTLPQANGLAFSVQKGLKIPPSLKNIDKELHASLAIEPAKHGDLSAWAKQGVLLLNTALTVRANQPGSHTAAWTPVMREFMNILADDRPLIYVLWGAHAHNYIPIIKHSKFGKSHVILTAAHPSPLSAHKGFLGCGHFKMINEQLQIWGKEAIDWQR